jgi:hypothetical protein
MNKKETHYNKGFSVGSSVFRSSLTLIYSTLIRGVEPKKAGSARERYLHGID